MGTTPTVVSSVGTTTSTHDVSTMETAPLASTLVTSPVGRSSSVTTMRGFSSVISGMPSIVPSSYSGGLSPAAAIFVPSAPVLTSSSAVIVVPSPATGDSTGSSGLLLGMHEPTLGAEGVMDTFSQLLKAQTDVMMAQVKAAVVQTLPSLSNYSGEGSDITDDKFDRWAEWFPD